jgi:hypothetical protein
MSYALATSVAPGVVILKVHLRQNGDVPELRRIRGSFTFEELQRAMRQLLNRAPQWLTIEYDDDEGDRIRIGSEPEWAEALQVHGVRSGGGTEVAVRCGSEAAAPVSNKGPVRLVKSEPAAEHDFSHGMQTTLGDDADLSSNDDDDDGDRRLLLGDRYTVVARGMAPCESVERVSTHDGMRRAPSTVVKSARSEPEIDGRGAAAASTEGQPEHEATFALLSQLYGCDFSKEMRGTCGRDFTPVVKRVMDAPAQVIRVEVDQSALLRLTLTQTDRWIHEGQHNQAEAVLKAALAVWPRDTTAIEYKLACSASLRRELATSLDYLMESVMHGCHGDHNVRRMKSDPDLANVRDHPDFSNVLWLAARGNCRNNPIKCCRHVVTVYCLRFTAVDVKHRLLEADTVQPRPPQPASHFY